MRRLWVLAVIGLAFMGCVPTNKIGLHSSASTSKSDVTPATVLIRNGNVVLQGAGGTELELTHVGRDSEATISPDNRWIVFVREYPETPGPWGPGTELRIVDLDGTGERVIVKDGVSSGRNKFLSSLKSPQFFADSRRVAFHSGWAATHGSVHVIDIKTGKIRFISAGNSVCVVTSGPFKDQLIIKIRNYFLGGGSYTFYYLVTLDGKVGQPVGNDQNDDSNPCCVLEMETTQE